ncbi:hypothetical protein WDU94_015497 [Cyamophila willieti]
MKDRENKGERGTEKKQRERGGGEEEKRKRKGYETPFWRGMILYTVCSIVLMLGKYNTQNVLNIPTMALFLIGIIMFAAELLTTAYMKGLCRKYLTLKNRQPQQEPQENRRNSPRQTESKDIANQTEESPKEAAVKEEKDNSEDMGNKEMKNEKNDREQENNDTLYQLH